MERRRLGQTAMNVSALGFGGAEIGFEGASVETVKRLLKSALDAGLNVIDTAECYLESEDLIGRAVSDRRADYFLFTKCGHHRGWDDEDWSVAGILESIERSLKRLRTDAVDLLQLHSCSEEELRRTTAIQALQEARSRGYTRYIGYSGDGAAARVALECGAFDTLQTSVSIADQEALELTLPLAVKLGVGVIAKRPLANAAWRYDRQPDNEYHVEYWRRLAKLRYDFIERDPAGAAAIALRFTLSIPGVSTAIVGTKNPRRYAQNAQALASGPLEPAQLEAICRRWAEVAPPAWQGQI
jgi:aryl-alcohol dehydrogenase-like predicted oxidoreductase